MTDNVDAPEPDAVPGARHPRHTLTLFGQRDAEATFLDAAGSGRIHHAWLITGPRGVGKATLAWRIARWLLSGGSEQAPRSLDVDPAGPTAHRISALSEPALLLLRRGWDDRAERLRTVITVDEVRRLGAFLGLSRPDGGRRVVIIDAADEMNANAANALLKVLEEPPRNTVILLVCHRPGALLPTIRSRCRVLRCGTLTPVELTAALEAAGFEAGEDALALAEQSGGSVGEAVRLMLAGGPEVFRAVRDLFATMPLLDRPAAVSLAEASGGRSNEARFDATIAMLDATLVRLARRGAGIAAGIADGADAALADRLAPTAHAAREWADLQAEFADRARHARAVNLDPASLILDMFLKANETAARTVGRAP